MNFLAVISLLVLLHDAPAAGVKAIDLVPTCAVATATEVARNTRRADTVHCQAYRCLAEDAAADVRTSSTSESGTASAS